MNVQITIRIEGREVETFERPISGDAFDREDAHRFGKDIGCVVAEQALSDWAQQHRRTPHCCGRPMNSRGLVAVTGQGLDGRLTIRRRCYRCDLCGQDVYPAHAELFCGCHRVTRPLAKKACLLATVEDFPVLPQLLFDPHGVRLGRRRPHSHARGRRLRPTEMAPGPGTLLPTQETQSPRGPDPLRPAPPGPNGRPDLSKPQMADRHRHDRIHRQTTRWSTLQRLRHALDRRGGHCHDRPPNTILKPPLEPVLENAHTELLIPHKSATTPPGKNV